LLGEKLGFSLPMPCLSEGFINFFVMRRSIFVLLFVMVFGGLNGAFAQGGEIVLEEIDTTDLRIKYYGNKDYLLAQKYYDAGDIEECRSYFEKAAQFFRNDENWEAYTKTNITYMKSFRKSEEYEIGVNIGKNAVKILQAENNSENKKKYIARMYFYMGDLYDSVYKIQIALSYFDEALEFEKDYVGDSLTAYMGLIYHNIGTSYAKMGSLDQGLNYFLKAKDTYMKAKDEETLVKDNLHHTIGNIGIISYNKGNYENALKYMKKGADMLIEVKGIEHPGLIRSYYNISNVYYTIGEYNRSIDYLEKGISLFETAKGKYPNYSSNMDAQINNHLGMNYFVKKKYKKAIAYFREAEKIEKKKEIASPVLLEIKLSLGGAYLSMGKYDQSLKLLYSADSLANIYRKESKMHTGAMYDIKFSIAEVLIEKEEFTRARSYIKQSFLEILEDRGSRSFQTAKNNVALGVICGREHKLDSALFYVQKALISLSVTFSDTDISSFPIIDDIKENNVIYDVLKYKAKFAQAKAEELSTKDAQGEYYKIALAAVDLADQLNSKQVKRQGSLRENQLKYLLESSLPFYRKGLDILANSTDLISVKQKIDKAFYFTQKMKARQLWATQLGSEAKQLGKIDKAILEKEQQLLSDIQYYEKQVITAQQRKDSVNLDLYQNTYLFNTKNDYRNLLAEIEENYPDFFETKFAFNPASLSDVQSSLNEDEIVLEYTFSNEDYVYLFVIEKEKEPQFIKISIDAQTDENISKLTKMLRRSSMERNTSREKFVNLSHTLYNQLIEPAKDYIAGKKRLIIIGEGKTNYIPFEALVQSDELKPFTDLDYLLNDYEVSYHYSSTLFNKSRKQLRTNSNSGIFAFAPVYESNIATNVSNPMRSLMVSDSTFRAFDTEGNFTPLPESEKEVKAIANLFKQKGIESLNIALRKDANEENLKSNLQKSYQYIHIAGHSFANLKNPKFSGIACFQEGKDAKEDGILYAGEIYNLSTKADLFTLSSCESGFGKLEETEGLLGLNRAFIYAGAPNVTFSLWKIYDKVSAQCMIDFYEEILKDKSYATALRQAKLNLLKNEGTASPHYWSPFLLIGR